MADEVLERRELEAAGSGDNRRNSPRPRKESDGRNLDDKSPQTDQVEHTPPPDIQAHT